MTYPIVRPLLAVLLVGSGACARGPAMAPPPAPVPVVIAAPPADTMPPASAAGAAGALDAAAAPAATPVAPVAPTEITRQAVQVFGDSVVAETTVDSATGATFDIDVRSYETHERVAHYVRIFSGSARRGIEERLERGTRYEPMIRARFRKAGIPEDMYFLALIESGYDNNAYSRAAAVGMWQFMSSTATGLGLRVDWWIDERRDPVRATDGAVRFLKWLREQLGSYYLAAAAYNGGPGRVARGVARHASDLEGATGEDAFFALYDTDFLPRETRNYVPQLIAAALVGKQPARYGLRITPRAAYAYDSVQVGLAAPLAAVARAAGSTLAEVQELNPHVLRGMTPPTGRELWIRVPTGRAAGFDSAWQALPDDERKAFRRVVTTKGQTIASLARAHDRSARQLGWYNRSLATTRKGVLRTGQTVLVPSPLVVAGARDVPDPSVERYGSSKASSRGRYHVVKRGESLGLIAQRNKTTVARLKALNGLKKTMVFPGQALLVKAGAPARRGKATSATRAGATRSGARKTAATKAGATRSGAKKSSAKKSSAKQSSAPKAGPRRSGAGKAPAAKKSAKR